MLNMRIRELKGVRRYFQRVFKMIGIVEVDAGAFFFSNL